jgi:hypothetical protein
MEIYTPNTEILGSPALAILSMARMEKIFPKIARINQPANYSHLLVEKRVRTLRNEAALTGSCEALDSIRLVLHFNMRASALFSYPLSGWESRPSQIRLFTLAGMGQIRKLPCHKQQ